jgi:hypothetical protein
VAAQPLLFLDVDGVLNPFPNTPAGYDEYHFFPEDDEPVRLATVHRDWLRELSDSYELVWATGWGDNANRLLNPFFGLPGFPVVPPPPVPFEPIDKLPGVDVFAADRPAAWVDDMLTMAVHRWAAARRAPTLLVDIDSATGLTRTHVDRLLTWAATFAED